jgi:DNA-binding MarR family transcriptional regulator
LCNQETTFCRNWISVNLAFFLGLRINELVIGKMRKAGFGRVRESHGYLIQHLIGGGGTISELAERMGVSQQAGSKMVAELARLGVLDVSRGADRRARRVRLSALGWQIVRLTRQTRKKIADTLARQIGKRRYEKARRLMFEALDMLGGMEAIAKRRVRAPN